MIDIVLYGATGPTGQRAVAELEAAGASFVVASGRPVRAKVVLNCADPASGIDERLLVAALAEGAHYVDLGANQAALHAVYERHESTARRAERVAICGAGVACVLGDWAAALAAAYVCGLEREQHGDPVRVDAIDRVADDRPLDDVAVSYVFDDLALTPTGQRAALAGLHEKSTVWSVDRWEPVAPASESRRINAGLAMGGERSVVSFPGGEVVTIPRHLAAKRVQTFTSTSRRVATMTALRWLARAAPFVPKRATDALATYTPSDAEYARTKFAVIAQARRGFSAAQVTVGGHDLYRASAVIGAWVAQQLAARSTGPFGMRAPSELFRPEPALAAVAEAAGLVVEPSFA